MKNLLALDTSTNRAGVAIAFGEKIISRENLNIKQHAEYLLPMISELLREAQIGFEDLQGIVYGCGPGSFTGIRVTCSIAKALAYAHDLAMYPVSSLKAIAYQASDGKIADDTPVLAMLDARMQEVYWGLYSDFADESLQVSRESVIRIPSAQQVILAGSCLENSAGLLAREVLDKVVQQKSVYPDAISMLRLVQDNYIEPVEVSSALPLYVRNKVV